MKRVILNALLCIFLGVCETSCCLNDRLVIAEQPSQDGKIKVTASVDHQSITITLTNTSSESIAIDKELELLFDVDMYSLNGYRFIPYGRYVGDLHRNIPRVNGRFDPSFDVSEIDLKERIVTLKPGESVSRVYGEHDDITSYQYAVSHEERTSVSKFKWEIPKINKIAKIVVYYNKNYWDSSIPDIIAKYTNKELPDTFYRGKFEAEFEVAEVSNDN